MTKLQELLLSGGSRYGTKYISHTQEAPKPLEGLCIKTKLGWRAFNRPTVNHNQKPDDGRYRDGFIHRDGVDWSHSAWAHFQELHKERVAMTAARINLRGHDRMKIPEASKAGRFDKFGVKVMS